MAYFYKPDEGFEGEDRFTFQSIYKEHLFVINYRIFVSSDVTKLGREWHTDWDQDRGRRIDCEKPPFSDR